ncbi:MAG TPA: helix-turn-helix transcriptional regulator [Clostridiales bacterium]|nr:helix-turn-helix transcriptional regulator [Clostridiales bacterium]
MNYEKISTTLKFLRLQKDMTQKQLAEKLNLTEQAISKWERSLSLPDISICPILAEIFGVDLAVILTGHLEENQEVKNNMKNLNYYICPFCGNVVVSLSEVNISCCGRPIQISVIEKATAEDKMIVEIVEDEYFITSNHPQTKDDYISFTSFATGEKIEVIKHFPEWNLEMRIPKNQHGKVIWYSKSKGLKYQLI